MNLPSRDMTHFGEVQNYKSKACWFVSVDKNIYVGRIYIAGRNGSLTDM